MLLVSILVSAVWLSGGKVVFVFEGMLNIVLFVGCLCVCFVSVFGLGGVFVLDGF